MSIQDRISDDLKAAMLARDSARTMALRNLRAAIIEALKVDGSTSISDEAAIALLRGQAKKRQESVDAYTSAGREDLADAERAELAIIAAYLPQLADEDTVKGWVAEAIAATGATGPKEMGKVMGALTKAHKGEMDGAMASRLVKDALAALGG